MPLSPEHRAALAAVARMMAPARGPWWVIAGAAVALHGVPAVEVDDIDILFSAIDTALVAALPAMRRSRAGGTDRFRSGFYAASWVGGVRVEWMADFEVRADGHWSPVLPVSRQPVAIGDATVFVPDREELVAMLARFGRPKDRERITLLAG